MGLVERLGVISHGMAETQCADGVPKSPRATERPWATVVTGVPCGWLIIPADGANRCSGDEDRLKRVGGWGDADLLLDPRCRRGHGRIDRADTVA